MFNLQYIPDLSKLSDDPSTDPWIGVTWHDDFTLPGR